MNKLSLTAHENIWDHKNQIRSLGSLSCVCKFLIIATSEPALR